jgi:hypothetical protein
MKIARFGLLLGLAVSTSRAVRADDAPPTVDDEDPPALRLHFAPGSTRLQDESKGQQTLQRLSIFLAQHPEITKVTLEGHTNNQGTPERNLALSRARATAIKDGLMKLGVEDERLAMVGFGQNRPIADNINAAGRAINDRMDIRWSASPASKVAARPSEQEKPKAGVVDEYGGHYGSDGFYYDRFGGHYDEYGYEYKDGSYKTVCGDRYDVKSHKMFDARGAELRTSLKLTSPDEKKRFIRQVCQVAKILAKEAKNGDKSKAGK